MTNKNKAQFFPTPLLLSEVGREAGGEPLFILKSHNSCRLGFPGLSWEQLCNESS